MPPLCSSQSIHAPSTFTSNLSHVVRLHGGILPHHYTRPQPYVCHISGPNTTTIQSNYNLPPTLLYKIADTQEAATMKSLQKKDASRLREFLLFCAGLRIRANDALPAKEEILLAWASSYAGRLAGKTVSAKLLAIRKEHERRGLIWMGGARLRRILKGVEELRPQSSFQTKRASVTIAMLEDLNRGLNRSSGLDICIRAICNLSFLCQLRSGEVLPPTQDFKKFDSQRHATFANIAQSTAMNGACNLHLPWSKTQKSRGDNIWIPRQEAPLDPIHALHKHFIKNKLTFDHPIAAYRDEHGNILTLTRSKFI